MESRQLFTTILRNKPQIMYIQPEVSSSYEQNNLGKTIYDQIRYRKPEIVIDFGVLDGYSTIAIAQALRENGKGKVYAFDLFEKYPYKHAQRTKLEKNIEAYGLLDWVVIEEQNFYDWIKKPTEFDAIHLDISNDGDIIDILWNAFKDTDKLIMFEGGSEQRDRVGWMVEYNKKPIQKSEAKYQIINDRFPSISKLCLDQN